MLERTWKRVGHGKEREVRGWEKRNKKRRRNGKSFNLPGRHVTGLLPKYYMVAYEW